MDGKAEDEGGSTDTGKTRVQRVGDTPGSFTVGMLTIGLVLGVFLGILVWAMVAPEPTPASEGVTAQDVEDMSRDVDEMSALVAGLERQLASTGGSMDGVPERLQAMQEDLDGMSETLDGIQGEIERRQGVIDGAGTDLAGMRSELLDIQLKLLDLKLELDDLLARIEAGPDWGGGGGGGGGNTTVPENATLLPSLHLVHYNSRLLVFSCDICHDTVPAGEVIVSGRRMYFNGSLDDPGFNTVIDKTAECVECHGQFPENGMDASYKDATCTACHDDWATRMTATYVREPAISDDDCLTCHGGPNAFMSEVQKYTGP